MPGPKKKTTRSHKRTAAPTENTRLSGNAADQPWKVLVIDNRPLQRAAWAEFHTARKRLEKAAGDLHRHEEIDRPAYDSWLHRTFPVWVTTLRELFQEVSTKRHQVQTVLAMGELTGRSLKKLWREQKEYEANPEALDEEADPDDAADAARKDKKDPEESDAQSTRRSRASDDAFARAHRPATATLREAKEIYRRLVQHLHPDRGGAWTPTRMRLWHEVQQAWAAGDADWLSRLEIEWETANDALTPNSPLSRLRRAIAELFAARRDTERRLREYRTAPQWRFTLSEKKRPVLHARTEENFRQDIELLRRQLTYLNSTIAAWEDRAKPASRAAPKRPYDSRKRSWMDF